MTSHSTRTRPLLHLFNWNRAFAVAFDGEVLTVRAKSGRITHTFSIAQIAEIQLQRQALFNQLIVRTKQGRSITVNGLDRATSVRLHSQLQIRVEEILNDEASRKATALDPRITDLKESTTTFLTPDRYIRRSHAAEMTGLLPSGRADLS